MKIGLFEAGLPNCEHDAGSTATVELCSLVKEMGNDLQYIYTGENPWGRSDDLEKYNIPQINIPLADNKLKAGFLKDLELDAAIISRPGPAMEWLYACDKNELPVVYFGHDIHHIRMQRGNNFLPQDKQVSVKDINLMKVIEQNIWKKVSSSIYPSKQECDIVNEYCNKENALEMPIYDLLGACQQYQQHNIEPKKDSSYNLLFVGGIHHLPNYDAMIWFSQEIKQHLKIAFTLNIVGDWPQYAQKEVLSYWGANSGYSQNIIFHNRLEQNLLFDIYKKAYLVIAPLRFGAGIKRKIVESVAFCKPTLSTSIGFEGIDVPNEINEYFLSETEGKAFADKINFLEKNGSGFAQAEINNFSNNITAKYNNNYRKKVLEKAFSFL